MAGGRENFLKGSCQEIGLMNRETLSDGQKVDGHLLGNKKKKQLRTSLTS